MPQKLIDQTTIQPDGRPGDDAFTAFATCNDNFADAEGRLSALEGGSSNIGQDVADLKTGLQQETLLRTDADTALSQAVAAEVTARQSADTALGARFIGKNLLINGDFRFWQRATTSAAAAARRYVADRWEVWSIGTTTQVDAMVINDGSIDPPARFSHRVIVSSVAGTGNIGFMRQHIEDVRTASGKTVTFSVRLYSQSASKIAVNIAQNFGVGGSAAVNTTAQKFDLVAGWQTVTAAFNIPSVSGKTIGTSSSLIMQIWMDAGADYNTVTDSLGQRSGTYWFANAQLELGSKATAFEYRPDALELALCQRYYEKSYNLGVFPGTADRNGSYRCSIVNGFFFSAGTIAFAVQKRATPAISVYAARDGTAGAGSEVNSSGVFVANRNVTPSNMGTSRFQTGSNNGGAAAGNTIEFQWTADAEL